MAAGPRCAFGAALAGVAAAAANTTAILQRLGFCRRQIRPTLHTRNGSFFSLWFVFLILSSLFALICVKLAEFHKIRPTKPTKPKHSRCRPSRRGLRDTARGLGRSDLPRAQCVCARHVARRRGRARTRMLRVIIIIIIITRQRRQWCRIKTT